MSRSATLKARQKIVIQDLEDRHEECIREIEYYCRGVPDNLGIIRNSLKESFPDESIPDDLIQAFLRREKLR